MPVLSTIFPKLYENPCDCLLVNHILQVFEPRCTKRASFKQAEVSKLNSIASFLSQGAHDNRCKNRDKTVICRSGLELHTREARQVRSNHE